MTKFRVDAPAPRLIYTFKAFRNGRPLWEDGFGNLVTTGGKNDLLDKYFSGSSYTAAWYLGLINNAGFTAIAAGDTAASHSGWTEAGQYGAGTRPAITWAAASGGSKATTAEISFTMDDTVTINGGFVITDDTKNGTSGILYSAGSFNTPRALQSADELKVTVTMNMT